MQKQQVKSSGDNGSDAKQNKKFTLADRIDPYLGSLPVVRVPQPCNQCKNSHRHGHTEVSNHLPVVRKPEGNNPVQQTEKNHQKLTERVPLGVENERRHADQRCRKGQVVLPVKNTEGGKNQGDRKVPQKQFVFGKDTQFFHKKPPKKRK